jgi:hypothetical protein
MVARLLLDTNCAIVKVLARHAEDRTQTLAALGLECGLYPQQSADPDQPAHLGGKTGNEVAVLGGLRPSLVVGRIESRGKHGVFETIGAAVGRDQRMAIGRYRGQCYPSVRYVTRRIGGKSDPMGATPKY